MVGKPRGRNGGRASGFHTRARQPIEIKRCRECGTIYMSAGHLRVHMARNHLE